MEPLKAIRNKVNASDIVKDAIPEEDKINASIRREQSKNEFDCRTDLPRSTPIRKKMHGAIISSVITEFNSRLSRKLRACTKYIAENNVVNMMERKLRSYEALHVSAGHDTPLNGNITQLAGKPYQYRPEPQYLKVVDAKHIAQTAGFFGASHQGPSDALSSAKNGP